MKYIENRMERSKYNDIIFSKILFDEVQPKCYFNSICRRKNSCIFVCNFFFQEVKEKLKAASKRVSPER